MAQRTRGVEEGNSSAVQSTGNAEVNLPRYKQDFIDSAITIGALTLSEEKALKSGRKSSYFFNMGGYNRGEVTKRLAGAYAATIKENFPQIAWEKVIIYGIPEKGVGFAVAVAAELSTLDIDAGWCFSRKMPKTHGDATGQPTTFVGQTPKAGDTVILLDDVLTTGETKEEAIATIRKISPDIKIIGLVIALDRQEVGFDGKTAVRAFEEKNGVKTVSIVNSSDINAYLTTVAHPLASPKIIADFRSYLRAYGSDEAIQAIGINVQSPIFNERYGVIPACDGLSIEEFGQLVDRTSGINGIVGYKVGAQLINQVGLKGIRVAAGPKATLIVDWQKWGGDIPDMNQAFIRDAKAADIKFLINFPHSGPETQRSAIYRALQEGDVTILGGAWMTHAGFEASDGGPFTEDYLLNAYRIWARSGITTFIVPATKPKAVKKIVEAVEDEFAKLGLPDQSLSFASPGIGAQGGDTKALLEAIGTKHAVFAIEGRSIMTKSTPDASDDITERAKAAVEKIRNLVTPPVELRASASV
jgi:orotate phosphoribosyltransferase